MNLETAKHLENLELELMQPEVRRSEGRLDELIADDFLEFGMNGVKFSKKDILDILPNSEEEKYERITAGNFETKEIAPDTILLTYEASIEFIKTGVKINTLRSSIWQKVDDWQMIFHQGTIIKD